MAVYSKLHCNYTTDTVLQTIFYISENHLYLWPN